MLCIRLVSITTLFLSRRLLSALVRLAAVLFSAPVPLLVLARAFGFFLVGLQPGAGRLDLPAHLGLSAALCLIGLGSLDLCRIVPGAVTVPEAASLGASLLFMLVGGGHLWCRSIIAYAAYSYRVFRGRTGHEGLPVERQAAGSFSALGSGSWPLGRGVGVTALIEFDHPVLG